MITRVQIEEYFTQYKHIIVANTVRTGLIQLKVSPFDSLNTPERLDTFYELVWAYCKTRGIEELTDLSLQLYHDIAITVLAQTALGYE